MKACHVVVRLRSGAGGRLPPKDQMGGLCQSAFLRTGGRSGIRGALHAPRRHESFQRIRHYGFLANRYREQKLARCRDLLKMPPPEPKSEKNKDYRDQYEELTGTSLKICPICHQGHMAVIEVFEAVTTPPAIIDTS
jgi:hypothetical protein